METLARLIPQWLVEWFKVYAVPFIKVEGRKLLVTVFKGAADVLLFLGLPLTLSITSQAVWNTRYNLIPNHQQQVMAWAGVSSLVAYIEDVPPVVPLVLWYKEGGLRAENPLNCEGIMGLYSAVNTGELPCFPPGEVHPEDIAYQLQLGARTFKSYCPEVSYTTTDPQLLKRCYLYYNAGPRSRSDPDKSAYVMNAYDEAHRDMLHTDIQGRSYQLKALGAWPTHLAIQALLAQTKDTPLPSLLLAPAMLAQEKLDQVWATKEEVPAPDLNPAVSVVPCKDVQELDCLVKSHDPQNPELQPILSPLLITPTIVGDITCSLIPNMELGTQKSSLVVAPAQGSLTQYTDERGNLAVQIENDEWAIWLIGLRSYVTAPGYIEMGQPVGAIGGENSDTQALQYAIYDKINTGFIDPTTFLPAGACSPAN